MAIRQADIMKPLGRPRRVVSKPRHTASVLVRRSWPSRRKSAKQIAVRSVKVIKLPRNEMFKAQTVAYRVVTYSKLNKHLHRVTVFVDSGWFSSKSRPVVDCSCADFVYTFEYVLAYTGNGMIWRCNGDTPDERNPGHRLGLCKHAIAALTVMHRRSLSEKLVRSTRSKAKINWRRGK